MNRFFPEVKRNFGFGCMRLPMLGDEVDLEQVKAMVDAFLEAGFNYFDTAHPYISGKSELAVRECLSSRYDRSRFVLANKLTGSFFKTEADLPALFESQLAACGVEYFDFLLVHAVRRGTYEHYEECHTFEFAARMKAEGKAHHVGMSFHDSPEVLDEILCKHPELEFVQLQFNYLDAENPSVQSRRCYEVCVKHGKPVVVMEPVKGGKLVELPEEAVELLSGLGAGSTASYAIRYAASFENIAMVLSGMSTTEQMQDNLSFMQDFRPLSEEEKAALTEVTEILKRKNLIPCTACRYCTDGCPMQIPIPDIFSIQNASKLYGEWGAEHRYRALTENTGKASDCIRCGACEGSCPQGLPIRELLEQCAAELETE